MNGRPILRLKAFAQDNEAPFSQCPEPCGLHFRPSKKGQKLCDNASCAHNKQRLYK